MGEASQWSGPHKRFIENTTQNHNLALGAIKLIATTLAMPDLLLYLLTTAHSQYVTQSFYSLFAPLYLVISVYECVNKAIICFTYMSLLQLAGMCAGGDKDCRHLPIISRSLVISGCEIHIFSKK